MREYWKNNNNRATSLTDVQLVLQVRFWGEDCRILINVKHPPLLFLNNSVLFTVFRTITCILSDDNPTRAWCVTASCIYHSVSLYSFFPLSWNQLLVSSPFCSTALTTVKTMCSCECARMYDVVVLSQPVSRCQGAGGLQMVVIPLRQRQEERDWDRGRKRKEK